MLHFNDTHGASSSKDTNQDNIVDDNVGLQCGCHFHWDLNTRESYLGGFDIVIANYTLKLGNTSWIDNNLAECPNYGKDLVKVTELGTQQLLCNIKNEGGLQESVNILLLLPIEECYLKTFSEKRRSRAFLEFCRELRQ